MMSYVADIEMNDLVKKEVSPEYLINLVEERPLIWDQSAELYRDHTEKKKAWRDICDALFENFNELDDREKQILTKSVIKKWSHIRDTWMKSMKKRESLDSTRRPYIYEEEMSFMRKVFDMNYKEGSGKASPDSESSDESVKVEVKKRKIQTKKAKVVTKETVKPVVVEESSDEEISNSDKMTINLDDHTGSTRHILFFKSILPSLVKLSDNQILEYQAGVLKLLLKLNKPQSSTQDDEPTTSCSWPLVNVTHVKSAQQSDKSSEQSFIEEDIFS